MALKRPLDYLGRTPTRATLPTKSVIYAALGLPPRGDQSHPPKGGHRKWGPPLIFPSIDDREGEGGYQTADGLPEFQGPKYRGSFRRGDFADFHQRFSLVPRRCAGKYPPAAREIRADSWAPSIRVARTRSAYPPGIPPLDFPDTPPNERRSQNSETPTRSGVFSAG